MREYLSGVAGNADLRRRLGNDIEKGLFSHAYILAGPKGIGKERLALEIAASLACEHRTDAGYPVGSNNLVKVTYGYDIDGVDGSDEDCHAIIDLSSSLIP